MYPPARGPRESSSLERAACGPCGLREFMLRLHLLHSVSRGWNASEGVGATDDCDTFGDPSRLRLKVASFLRGSALLRRRPETVAAHSRAGRPSASAFVERLPSAAQHWECVEVDFTEFKRKALRELSGRVGFSHTWCR